MMSLFKVAWSGTTAIFIFYNVLFFHTYTPRILRSFSAVVEYLWNMFSLIPFLGLIFLSFRLDFVLKLVLLILGGFGAIIGIFPIYAITKGALGPLSNGALLLASIFCAMQSGLTLVKLGFVAKSTEEVEAYASSGHDGIKLLTEWMAHTHKRMPSSQEKIDLVSEIAYHPEMNFFFWRKAFAIGIIDHYVSDLAGYLSSLALLILSCEKLGLFKTQSSFFTLFNSIQCSLSLLPSSPVDCHLLKNQAWTLTNLIFQPTIFIFVAISIASSSYELANSSSYKRLANRTLNENSLVDDGAEE